jgi:RNA-directed DNA polymerase
MHLEKRNSKKPSSWHEINWLDAYNRLGEIQQNIVEATRFKDLNKTKLLQRKLVNSYSARVISIRKVVSNKGSQTAGVDKILWETPKDKFKAIEEIRKITHNPSEYKASPVKRVIIPKSNDKGKRTLGIPTMIDRAIQALYHMAVDPVIECNSDLNSYGFRKHRSTLDAIVTLRNLLDKAVSPQWILEADIEKCFDKISHDFLKEITPICDKKILEEILSSGIQIGGQIEKNIEGTPQGGVISPLLCNVALNGLEDEIKNCFSKSRDKVDKETGERSKVNVIRYADDLVITGSSKQILETAKQKLEEFLAKRGLKLKESKTRIINIRQGFEFLGYSIRRYDKNLGRNRRNRNIETTLIIKPTTKAERNVKKKIYDEIKHNKSIKSIIRGLNPIICGWTEYYRIDAHSKVAFKRVNDYVNERLEWWARKRHSGITWSEIMSKYIVELKGKHKWTWGESETNVLLNPAETTIWTLRPMKLGLNPYLKENWEYFERRKQMRSASKFRSIVYKNYDYKCPLCKQELLNGEPIELDHIIPKREGGIYSIKNIRPLHRECHKKVTYQVFKQEPVYQSEDLIDEQIA